MFLLQTPYNPPKLSPINTITPKVDLSRNTIRRRPITGEMAVSLAGSPLMVSAVAHEEFASVSVPLPDGKVCYFILQFIVSYVLVCLFLLF